MKALNHKFYIAFVILITILAIAGCQPGSKEQAPTIPQPTIQPTEAVLFEEVVSCSFVDLELKDGFPFKDPELGGMGRGYFISWRYDCQNPYLDGNWVGWQDFYSLDGGESFEWYGYYEGITDEGGVWITSKDTIPPGFLATSSTAKGEGKYKGSILKSELVKELDMADVRRYRMTKPPATAPTAIPEGTVVVEGETNCPIVDNTSEGGIEFTDPELGAMERGAMVTWRNDCSDPYVGGQCFGLQDSYSPGGDTVYSKIFYECITGDGGVWLCNSDVKPPGSLITCEGLSKYKGLLISEKYNLETGTVKYRVTQLYVYKDLPAYLENLRIYGKEYQNPQLSQYGKGYLLYLPEGYETDNQKAWPLIYFLHGMGEIGDNVYTLAKASPFIFILNHGSLPAIIVAPLAKNAPPDTAFPEAYMDGVLKEVQANYRIDPKRIYLTGLSLGGEATWRFALYQPDTFAAIAPLSTWLDGADPARMKAIKSLPVWAIHGAEDDTVPLASGQQVVDALKDAGGNVKFTVLEDYGHDTWTNTYADPAFYDWLFQYTR